MKLLDANILLYAYNSSSQEHRQAQRWLEGAFAAPDPVGLCWLTIWAFLRISTNSRVFQQPLQTSQATRIVSKWLSHPSVTLLAPGDRYWSILSRLVVESQCRGPLISDASLAALALEHGAVLCTTDKDFTRFSELRTLNPLAGA
jgi:toxin-antitoxin system PIN domain toxin